MKQRGVSLFIVLLVIVVVAGAVLLGFPWYSQRRELARTEKVEADAMRGVAPSASPNESKDAAAARERAEKAEFAETHKGWETLANSAAYHASSPQCRASIDTYVSLMSNPEDSAAFRASVTEAQSHFNASCVEPEAQTEATTPDDAKRAEVYRQIACSAKREKLAQSRSENAATTTEERRKLVEMLEADVAANCQ